MDSGLFGNETAEKVLLYIQNYREGYAKGIAECFDIALSQVQRQLLKLEREQILVSQKKGNTRIFTFNPRYPYNKELSLLLKKILEWQPKSVQQKYFRNRTRPRRTGKPL